MSVTLINPMSLSAMPSIGGKHAPIYIKYWIQTGDMIRVEMQMIETWLTLQLHVVWHYASDILSQSRPRATNLWEDKWQIYPNNQWNRNHRIWSGVLPRKNYWRGIHFYWPILSRVISHRGHKKEPNSLEQNARREYLAGQYPSIKMDQLSKYPWDLKLILDAHRYNWQCRVHLTWNRSMEEIQR